MQIPPAQRIAHSMPAARTVVALLACVVVVTSATEAVGQPAPQVSRAEFNQWDAGDFELGSLGRGRRAGSLHGLAECRNMML